MQGCSTGVLSSVHCYALNSRKTAMVNQMCDSLHGSIAEQFQFLVVALVLMVVIQTVKRMARPTREQQGYGDNKVNPTSM